MAAKLVRCVEGHIFDLSQNTVCPTCGSDSALRDPDPPEPEERAPEPAVPTPIAIEASASASESSIPSESFVQRRSGRRAWLVPTLGGAVVVLIAAGFLLRWIGGSPATTASTQPSAVNVAQKQDAKATLASPASQNDATASDPLAKTDQTKASARSDQEKPGDPSDSPSKQVVVTPPAPPAPPQPQTVQNPSVNGDQQKQASNPSDGPGKQVAITPPAPPPQPQPQPKQSTAEISGTLKGALAARRMFVALDARNFQAAAQIAKGLIAANVPAGGYVLGRLYESGAGVPQDAAAARKNYDWAARLGDPEASFSLAYMLERGVGGPQDPQLATSLYLFAARNMVAGADAELQRLKLTDQRGPSVFEAYNRLMAGGDRTQSDFMKADKAMRDLYDRRSGPAICAVGWLYYYGNTVTQDVGRAAQLFSTGSQRDLIWCAWGMATVSAFGAPGVPKNPLEARVWYFLVQSFGSLGDQETQINRAIGEVEQQLSPADLQLARQIFSDGVQIGRETRSPPT